MLLYRATEMRNLYTRVKFEIVTDVTPSSDNVVQFWPRQIFVAV